MRSKEACDIAVGGWYWIYFVGPFAASFLVAEITNMMEWKVDDEDDASHEGTLPEMAPVTLGTAGEKENLKV